MSFKIVVDSCTDLSHIQRQSGSFTKVPLSLLLDGHTIVDDDTFDQLDFLARMDGSPNAPQSACPSPAQYMDAYDCGAQDIYVVTLSALLSGSHNSAMQGRALFLEEHPEVNIHVFNSCSASSGQVLISLKIEELARAGKSFEEVVSLTEAYIASQDTFFVLENLDNLRKNGRLSRIQSIVTGTIKLKLLMGATPEGEINKRGQALSVKQALGKMAHTIQENPNHVGKSICICHCNNRERAYYVRDLIEKNCQFSEILIAEAGGITTLYANQSGIVVAY